MRHLLPLRLAKKRAAGKPAPEDHPDPPDKHQIERINELTRTARTTWFALLSYLAFVGVTLLGVEDADFFIPERQTDLPLIGVSIPTVLFFWVAPTLGAALYTYFHFHLLKLYEALAAASTDTATPLSDRVTPWLVTDLALFWRKGALTPRPMRWLALGVALLLAYLAGPIVLGGFWFWSWPYHHEWLTVLGCGIPFLITLYAGRASWAHKQRLLAERGKHVAVRVAATAIFLLVAVGVTALGWLATEGSLEQYARRSYTVELFDLNWRYGPHFNEPIEYEFSDSGELVVNNPAHDYWWGDPTLNTFLQQANLAGVDFVSVPDDWREHDTARQAFRTAWCRSEGIPATACRPASAHDEIGTARSASLLLSRENWCDGALPRSTETTGPSRSERCSTLFRELDTEFADAWQIEWAAELNRLAPRSLQGADLREADLDGAQLQGASLWGAQLSEDTDLSAATLRGAALRSVDDTTLAQLQPHWDDILLFAETLPDGAPAHWVQIADADFDYTTFVTQWRDWAASLDPPVTIAPDYRR